jgi:hypothetical protein
MENAIRNKELPIPLQFAALVILWLLWASAVAYVLWKQHAMRARGVDYAEPFAVFSLVYAAFPLVLVVAGILFLRRLRPVDNLSSAHRVFYHVVAGLTYFGAAVFLICGTCSLQFPGVVRE